MQRRHIGHRELADQRELKQIDVEVENVEFAGSLPHLFQHHHVIGDRIPGVWIQAQRLFGAFYEFRVGYRIAACEQRHLVPLPNEFFGQIGDNPLGAAVQFGRNTLEQRGNLRDSHYHVPVRGQDDGRSLRAPP